MADSGLGLSKAAASARYIRALAVLSLDPKGIDAKHRDVLLQWIDDTFLENEIFYAKARGAVLMRTGSPQAAVGFVSNTNQLLFKHIGALAFLQLGETEAAERLLEETGARFRDHRRQDPQRTFPASFDWKIWLINRLLHHEAASKLAASPE